MSRCGAVGALTVGARVVGQISCELDAGHDEIRVPFPAWPTYVTGATPHSMTLTWAPEGEPDLDLFDPDESFDVVVEL